MKKIGLLFLFAFYFISCSTVPITGRKRLNFVSDSKVLTLSFAQYKGFLEENKLSTDEIMRNQIKKVGKKISGEIFVNLLIFLLKILLFFVQD